jgi:16S rRNA (cytidine1402-2'-O)-methyltransferase
LASGAALALVSDAGMPTVNDPGADLAARAAMMGIRVHPVPGPSAVLTAIAGAGLPTDEFTFIGFPPPKSSARVKRLRSLARNKATLIMFVPPHKLIGTLEDAHAALGDRRCAVCRELTKVHEEFWRSTLSEARAEFERRAPRGEITLVIEGYDGDELVFASDEENDGAPSSLNVEDAVRALLEDGASPSDASRRVAKDLGVRRREAYGVAQRLSEELKRLE